MSHEELDALRREVEKDLSNELARQRFLAALRRERPATCPHCGSTRLLEEDRPAPDRVVCSSFGNQFFRLIGFLCQICGQVTFRSEPASAVEIESMELGVGALANAVESDDPTPTTGPDSDTHETEIGDIIARIQAVFLSRCEALSFRQHLTRRPDIFLQQNNAQPFYSDGNIVYVGSATAHVDRGTSVRHAVAPVLLDHESFDTSTQHRACVVASWLTERGLALLRDCNPTRPHREPALSYWLVAIGVFNLDGTLANPELLDDPAASEALALIYRAVHGWCF